MNDSQLGAGSARKQCEVRDASWCMVYSIWYIIYGIWCIVHGIWCMAYSNYMAGIGVHTRITWGPYYELILRLYLRHVILEPSVWAR